MQVDRNAVCKMMEEIGMKTASGWSDEKLHDQVMGLPESLGDSDELEFETNESLELCDQILSAISAGEEIDIVVKVQRPSTPKKKKKKPVKKEETKVEEEPEVEAKAKPVKKTAKKTPKEEEPSKEETKPVAKKKKVAPKKETSAKAAEAKPVKKKTSQRAKPVKKKTSQRAKADNGEGKDALGGRLGTGVAEINAVLLKSKKPLSTTIIAERSGMPASRVSSHMSTLLQKGLVVRNEESEYQVA